MQSSRKPRQVLVVYGTRPELIKLAPVIFELRRRPAAFDLTVCSTAQHRSMVDELHGLFGIQPDIDLDLMRPDQKLNDLLSRALTTIDGVLANKPPDWMLVQGDTTTVMAASLAAFHRGVKVGHVEAGLRTGDLQAPFPEEANRGISDLVADLMFAPTGRAREVLIQEGRDPGRVYLTGNTVVDALQWISKTLPDEPDRNEVLITVHRRESFGQPLSDIFLAIRDLSERFADVDWVYPVHRNPNVRGPALEMLGDCENIRLCDPLPYDRLVRHLKRCRLVLTDSGGIQEEAPTFGKPVLVLREKTERPEGVDMGVARLIGTHRQNIVQVVTHLLTDESAYRRMACTANPYGDGLAAVRIAQILEGKDHTPLPQDSEESTDRSGGEG